MVFGRSAKMYQREKYNSWKFVLSASHKYTQSMWALVGSHVLSAYSVLAKHYFIYEANSYIAFACTISSLNSHNKWSQIYFLWNNNNTMFSSLLFFSKCSEWIFLEVYFKIAKCFCYTRNVWDYYQINNCSKFLKAQTKLA